MPASLFQRGVSSSQAPQFQPSGTSSSFLNQISGSLDNISQDMQSKADNIYINSFLTDARKSARDIFNRNSDNPEQLAKELDAHKQGLLTNMPASLQDRLSMEYGSLSESYLNKATTTKNKVLTLEQHRGLANSEDQITKDLQFAARELFDNKNLSEDEIISKNAISINTTATSLNALESNLSSIGADGKLLRTPKQITSSIQRAREFFFSEAASSWLQQQPDKMKAYQSWLHNEVVVNLPEGTLNLRDSISPEVRAKVDRKLISDIKNEIFIDDKAREQEERDQEEKSEILKKDLYKISAGGALTPSEVEESRHNLDYQDYKDLLTIAKEANPITDGNVYGNLVNRIENGEDISEDLRIARFNKKALSNEDYEKLSDKNKTKGIGASLDEPVQEARDYLLGFLGSSAEALSMAESQTMARAERDYNTRIADFIKSNDRNPSRVEALDIADEVGGRYNLVQTDKYAGTLPKPKAMPIDLKVKMSQLTPESLDKVEADTLKSFMEKHNGSKEAVMSDPKFIEELKLLKAFEPIAALNIERAKAAESRRRK